MQTELKLRILSGIVMAVVVLFATWAGGLTFQILSVAIALLVYYEWSTMTRLADVDFQANAFGWLSQIVVAGLILFDDVGLTIPVLSGFAIVSLLWVMLRKGSFWQPGGIVYAGLTGISLSAIRGDDSAGLIAMLFVFAVVWATDILAYFTGRAIGGPKLAPRISPGKTWSGAIGGAVSGVIAGVALVSSQFSLDDLRLPVLALVLSVASQSGDLFESFIKRKFGAKDSSKLIPGHGGVMDRVDGLVFACFAALLLSLMQVVFAGAQTTSTGAILLGL
ncbi:phosphatidate cytidylyltransferase [Pararhizobium antarcticum]|uniref:Phosphatidate cytidylyltransferase n=1 Tax=Pararhizobium antarcticum TaxID=1798805 RepID=A0A657LL29_9HYPH|nr:phosphatidate cytidylyltransferase [Pararhizobium antarcticum]OJF89975.1 phosphatidate cytidylyltransferase [Pararhizobium antarcticum]OJF93192.1 phosphatidate cytidylyltransferase [Rhizobium sp. 58]